MAEPLDKTEDPQGPEVTPNLRPVAPAEYEAPRKQALVLSGGGADGAYAVGVLKALMNGRSPANAYQPLVPEFIAGTSIGSFNAAFLAGQWETFGSAAIGNLETVWLDRLAEQPDSCGNGAYRVKADPFDLVDPRCYVQNPLRPLTRFASDSASLGWEALQRLVHFVSADHTLLRRAVELLNFSSFISREPWRRTILDTIDLPAVRRSKIALNIAATNWATGELHIFKNSDMSDTLGVCAIEASSALPGFYPPAEVGSQPFVDGAVLMNTPLRPAIGAGGNEIYVIYLDPVISAVPLAHMDNTLETLYRMQQIAWAKTIRADIDAARRINDLVRLIRLAEARGEKSGPVIDELRRRNARYRLLTIHRFFPQEDFGGALGLLNLQRSRLERLIRLGFENAVDHDCDVAGCVLAAEPTPAAETNEVHGYFG